MSLCYIVFLCHALGGPLPFAKYPACQIDARRADRTALHLPSCRVKASGAIPRSDWLTHRPGTMQVGIHHVSFMPNFHVTPPVEVTKKLLWQVISETFCATLCNLDTNASHLLVARTSVDTSKIENELMLLKSSVLHWSWENLMERNLTHTYKFQNSSYDSSGTNQRYSCLMSSQT